MFDARRMIEQMMQGAAQRGAPGEAGQSSGGLQDLLGQLGGGGAGGASGLNLNDLLSNLAPGGSSAQSGAGSSEQASGGGLADLLGQLQSQLGGQQGGGASPGSAAAPGVAPSSDAPSSGGGLIDQLGGLFGQATDGVREGADRVGQSTGLNDIISQVSGGKSGEELLGQLQDLISQNQLGAGAALGGLGALVLGTQTGRSVAMNAAKVGALALIGGLAYKAYQNYADGQSPGAVGEVEPEAAPPGTGFEESAVSDQTAVTVLRAMMAAAAADGRLDPAEQQKLTANLSGMGLDKEAEEFIAREMNAPATPSDLAAGVRDQKEAMQVYAGARLAIEPDTMAEQNFLAELAERLGIDAQLARHIDATTRGLPA
ncbi:MAG: DUF533 domain-containing protein [Pseudomonadota bacterium]